MNSEDTAFKKLSEKAVLAVLLRLGNACLRSAGAPPHGWPGGASTRLALERA
jgi:hypothetical protein